MACFLPCIHDNCGSIGREKKGVDLGNDIEGMKSGFFDVW